MKTAVIIGSTGLVGSSLLEKLVQDPTFGQILAIVRKRPTAELSLWNNARVRCLEFDFVHWAELELQVKSFIGTQPSSFFCCLGTTISRAGSEENFQRVDLQYVSEFSKLAQACRAECLLVVSAIGADRNSQVFYSRTKGEMESAVAQTFKGRLHFFRPSLLLGDRKEFRFGERMAILLAPIYAPLLFGPLEQYRPVPAATVAEAMLSVAAKRSAAANIIPNDEIFQIVKGG